jgi:DNA-binding response OmpR family regulator
MENHYDVILLDMMLPLMNGYDVLKEIRGHRIWTPVLMLTAKDGERLSATDRRARPGQRDRHWLQRRLARPFYRR